ncbi:MAG: protein phosphatase 2C domain-containing protein [Myxococcota bacterium]|jgi:protein phosphatase|nr:protein phosphatase 2C domain-containing protein [Myxococcota bacterium]
MEIRFSEHSDTGVQRDENQDAMGHFATEQGQLFVVCDGMGGHAGGQIASRLAVDSLGESYAAATELGEPRQWLSTAIKAANRRIRLCSQEMGLFGMGTTAVALLIDAEGHSGSLAWVGDSRAYRYRAEELVQLSQDHTLVARLIAKGELSREQAAFHPQAGVMERTLGVELDVEVDTMALELFDQDVYLLCSDGLTTMVDEHDLRRMLREYPPLEVGAALLGLANARGGYDNITLQVVQVGRSRVQFGPSESGLIRLSDLVDELEPESEPSSLSTGRRWLYVLAALLVLVILALLAVFV